MREKMNTFSNLAKKINFHRLKNEIILRENSMKLTGKLTFFFSFFYSINRCKKL